ncbi:hypothetical protein vseg_005781 [Gypsophila vaccaria]
MFKRKEVDSSSDCSEVCTAKKLKVDSCVEFKLFNVTIRATPFYGFLGMDDTCEAVSDDQEKLDERMESGITVNNDDDDDDDSDVETALSLSLSLPHKAEEDVAPIEAVPLNVYNPNINVEWTVRKTLTKSDCDHHQCRLLIGKWAMENRIMPCLSESSRLGITTPDGVRIDVFDCDTRTQVGATLKKWKSTANYNLTDNWKRDFIIRRELAVGDVIGLCWDVQFHRLLFSVLRRHTRD